MLGLLAAVSPAPSIAATIIELDIPASGWTQYSSGLSSDGAVVLRGGRVGADGWGYALTTASGGTRFIPTAPPANSGDGFEAASNQGSFVAGTRELGSRNEYVAGRWGPSGEFLALDDPNDPLGWSAGSVISEDGNAIAGQILEREGDGYLGAFRWTSTDGMELLGGLLPFSNITRVHDMSADGSVIVGDGSACPTCGWYDTVPWIWDSDRGMRPLAPLSTHSIDEYQPPGSAHAVSPDGTTVVGVLDNDAFVWNEIDELALLDLSGLGEETGKTWAVDVTGDGSTVVGIHNGNSPEQGAFIWDEDHGARSIETLLGTLGFDPADWDVYSVSAISADGTRILFDGRDPSGSPASYLLVVPEPSSALLIGIGLALAGLTGRNHRV